MRHYLSKATALLICLAALAALSGCGSKAPVEAQPSPSPTAELVQEPPVEESQEPIAQPSQEPVAESSQEPVADPSQAPLDEKVQEPLGPAPAEDAFYGSWLISDYKLSRVSAISSSDAEALLANTLAYYSDGVFQTGTPLEMGEGIYSFTSGLTKDSIQNDYNVDLGDWGDGASQLLLVEVKSSDNFFGSRLFVLDSETLWIYHEGGFFLATRAGA